MERAIRYIRDAFFAGRTFADLADLNAQAEAWVGGPAAERRCPEDRRLSVAEAFAQEQPRLLALPEHPYPTDEQLAVVAGKTPYVRFDLNDYSIPHTHVQRTLTVVASPQQVRILDGAQLLACHRRSLRPRGANRGCGAYRDAGGPQAGRPRPPRHRPAGARGTGQPRLAGARRRARREPGHDHRRPDAASRSLRRHRAAGRHRRGARARRAAPQRGAPGPGAAARSTPPAPAGGRAPARARAQPRRARGTPAPGPL
ncbi:MAG: hypothetical protein MZV70_46785 [Desulfobacterales bacterium]|nr:hypothetical protein [Desulfobacterales bacterium]